MPRKSTNKGCRLDCGDVYDNAVKVAKSKYKEDVADVFEYDNGAVGVFLKSGKFRFVKGSTPEALTKLRSKRSKKSSKKSSKKHSKKQKGSGIIDFITGNSSDSNGDSTSEESSSSSNTDTSSSTTQSPSMSGGSKKKKLSLNSAVQLLRKYYSNKFKK